jgi:hypothetical protein
MKDSGTRRLMRIPSLCFSLFLLAFVSCENNPLGVIDSTGSSPILRSAAVLPSSVDLDVTTLGSSNRLNLTLTATISDPQGASDISGASYSIFAPGGDSLVASGTINLVQPAVDSLPATGTAAPGFAVDTVSAGTYRVDIQATDRAGHKSTTISQGIYIYKGKRAPVLSLPGARWLAQTVTDSVQYGIFVTASDAGGLRDIAHVTFKAVGSMNPATIEMYDDGLKTHADAVAGDAVFSVRAWIAPTTSISDVVLEFNAIDRENHGSATLRRPLDNSLPIFNYFNVPTTIQRPASGSNLVSFIVGVQDANGLSDIDSVYFRNLSSTSASIILMFDDGDRTLHGDTLAGDGRYSRILSIDASTSTGIKQFKFSVTDRLGARSDSTFSITIN